jgi:hypothetical protein
MTTHHVTITERETLATDDGRFAYRAACTCRWHGWAVFAQEQAKIQRDRHLEQAEIDARTLDEARKGEGEDSPMRALSLWQPWASLVAWGAKTIETRSFSTSYRGWLAIHATRAFPEDAQVMCHEEPFKTVLKAHGIRLPADLPRGAIIAVARLVDCRKTSDGKLASWLADLTAQERAFGNYAPGRFGWLLTNVQTLPEPIPTRGYQMLWDVPADVLAQINAQLALPA